MWSFNLVDLLEMQWRDEGGECRKIALGGTRIESQVLGMNEICLKLDLHLEFVPSLVALNNEIRGRLTRARGGRGYTFLRFFTILCSLFSPFALKVN